MRANFFLILPALFLCAVVGPVRAQTDSNPPMTNVPTAPQPHVVDVPQPMQPSAIPAGGTTSGAETDAAKIAEYQRRFAQGQELEKAGKLAEALAVFEGIIAEAPDAKGSLREAGFICMQTNDLPKADGYFEKLHELVPDYPAAIEALIQINQALKRDVKVELLIRDFAALRDGGKVPNPYFVRERIQLERQEIVISQFFDYTQDPNTVWMAEVFDSSGELKRRILLNYDPVTTQALRTKDAKYADTQVFNWLEHVIKDGQPTAINVYLQIFALPDYNKFRSAMLAILVDPPKPIYSAPIDAAPPR